MFRNILFAILTISLTVSNASTPQDPTPETLTGNFSMERSNSYWNGAKKAIVFCGVLMCVLQIPHASISTTTPDSTALVVPEYVGRPWVPNKYVRKDPKNFTTDEARQDDIRQAKIAALKPALIDQYKHAQHILTQWGVNILTPHEDFFNGNRSVFEDNLWKSLNPSHLLEAYIILGVRAPERLYFSSIPEETLRKAWKNKLSESHKIYEDKITKYQKTANQQTLKNFEVEHQERVKAINSAYDNVKNSFVRYNDDETFILPRGWSVF